MSTEDRTVRLAPAAGPFDHRAALAVLAAHAIAGTEDTDVRAGRHRRLWDLGGRTRPITCTLTAAGVDLELGGPGSVDHAVRAEVAQRVRHWFDLDAPVDAVDAHLSADAALAPLIAARPGIRVTRFADGFEAAVMTVIGQQVSLAAARLFARRLVDRYGGDGPGPWRGFPAPARLAAADTEELRGAVGLTTVRARTLQAVSGLFADGFRLDPGTDPAAARRELGAVKGVGPWTTGYLSVRVLADPDAFPATDAVLRRRLAELGAGPEPADRWSPYRSYAAARLWLSAVE